MGRLPDGRHHVVVPGYHHGRVGAGRTAAALLKLEDPASVDGPTIAGMASKLVQVPPYDIYVFSDEQGTYRVIFVRGRC